MAEKVIYDNIIAAGPYYGNEFVFSLTDWVEQVLTDAGTLSVDDFFDLAFDMPWPQGLSSDTRYEYYVETSEYSLRRVFGVYHEDRDAEQLAAAFFPVFSRPDVYAWEIDDCFGNLLGDDEAPQEWKIAVGELIYEHWGSSDITGSYDYPWLEAILAGVPPEDVFV